MELGVRQLSKLNIFISKGVCHADDISTFVNITSSVENYKANDKDFALIKLMANIVKNFALTGYATAMFLPLHFA